MKQYLSFALALLISISAFAQKSYDSNFTHTRTLKVSGKTIHKSGHLVFDGTDHLTMNYDQPQGEYFIIEGNRVKMNLDGKKANLDATKADQVRLHRATLLNGLTGNYEQVAADNNAEMQVTKEGNLKTVTITAKGKVPRGGYVSMTLSYRSSDGRLVRMVLEESAGTINTYELK